MIGLRPITGSITKPLVVGASNAEIGRRNLFRLYYTHMAGLFGEANIDLLNSDTDNCIMGIKNHEDVYKVLYRLRSMFDTSKYPADHLLY